MIAALLVALVAAAVIAAVAWPLVTRRDAQGAGEAASEPDRSLQDEIERSLRAIRELEFDHAAGSIDETDFAELDAAERARAAELLRRRDRRS